VRPVDVVHQLVGHQALVVDVHGEVAADVLALGSSRTWRVARLPSEGRLAIRWRSPPVVRWDVNSGARFIFAETFEWVDAARDNLKSGVVGSSLGVGRNR
jgi:hypothetical protein